MGPGRPGRLLTAAPEQGSTISDRHGSSRCAAARAFWDLVEGAGHHSARRSARLVRRCGYLFAHLHDKRFGFFPDTGSEISRESCDNPAGWSA
ncbi:hypothetical protein [Nonomuraea sp. NPDC049709]|uniref:hypothetical protein n=1 Tax=Nonomuraea sp. NPDC049709 TaxID=3154736 RepID=UPI003447137B